LFVLPPQIVDIHPKYAIRTHAAHSLSADAGHVGNLDERIVRLVRSVEDRALFRNG
jgi:hypothetical protein